MRDQAIFLYAFWPLEKGQASEAVTYQVKTLCKGGGRVGAFVSELLKSGM